MRKHLLYFLCLCSLLTVMLFRVQAADDACDGCTFGTFNGSPACISKDRLHLCQRNFPDSLFGRYIRRSIGRNTYATPDEIAARQNISIAPSSDLSVGDLKGIEYFTELKTLSLPGHKLNSLVKPEHQTGGTGLQQQSADIAAFVRSVPIAETGLLQKQADCIGFIRAVCPE